MPEASSLADPPHPMPDLQTDQTAAVDALSAAVQAAARSAGVPPTSAEPASPSPMAWLLHGVTGSGKTEVYLRAAQAALDAGRQVLLLVPEINLTPQFEARLAERFTARRLVSLHSGLTPAQRLRNWLLAHRGDADLVLGTRLAVWASLPRLGLLVVDEEHDPSYKQQEGARYSARDLAVVRGRLEGVPVVLGSATPSLETWHNVQQGRYRRLAMPHRIGGGALPRVRLVDLGPLPAVVRSPSGPHAGIAPALRDAMQRRIDAGEQCLVLLNRRGYAPVLQCTDCGWMSGCAHCSAWRVFHKGDRTLRCHHCGFTEPVPRACPDCGNLDIAPVGRGTERLQEQLGTQLHGRGAAPLRVARIDADTTRAVGSLQAQLAQVHAGEVDVLVGTQMVAKGHDFRHVTLVAAVNPDGALYSSDFRAAERLFALLMQAGGRAGRDATAAAGSELWIQTHHPEHPLFAALRRHDFDAFAATQLAERESAGLPPFSHQALLRAESKTVQTARDFLEAAAARLGEPPLADHPARAAVLVYPAVPMPMLKVADVERAQMLVESSSRPALQRLLAAWLPHLHTLRREHRGLLRWAVDVDPLAL
jgi:primosomal protein N' (replication factor Y)